MPAESQKLIAYGKVMEPDEKTLEEFKIKENDFIVVMVQKVSDLCLFLRPNLQLVSQKMRKKMNRNQL